MARKRDKQNLKTGFTTGAAAAAAAKAALLLALTGEEAERVRIGLLPEGSLEIPVKSCFLLDRFAAECSVIKDAGDDPDVTHGAEIGVRVRILEPVVGCRWSVGGGQRTEERGQRAEDEGQRTEGRGQKTEDGGQKTKGGRRMPEAIEIQLAAAGCFLRIVRGKGVGVVTKPGLEVAPGLPAVTRGPQTMMAAEVEEVLERTGGSCSVEVEIFVKRGEELATKTMNVRLGIVGGLSILGTTGLVHPLSHAAYQASIEAGIRVARAAGLDTVVLTTGRRSERYAQALLPGLPEEAFIQMGDFFQDALQAAADEGAARVVLAVFWGKAVKMAQGFPQTHAARSELSLKRLAEWAYALNRNASLYEEIQGANTARQTFPAICSRFPELIAEVAGRIRVSALGFAGNRLEVRVVILDFEGRPVFPEPCDRLAI